MTGEVASVIPVTAIMKRVCASKTPNEENDCLVFDSRKSNTNEIGGKDD
ncbi:hypothetical protein ACFQH2_06385 [Natronoarchaeum sp. GCM10025703]